MKKTLAMMVAELEEELRLTKDMLKAEIEHRVRTERALKTTIDIGHALMPDGTKLGSLLDNAEIIELWIAGAGFSKKLHAVGYVRLTTGLPLREAKRALEELWAASGYTR